MYVGEFVCRRVRSRRAVRVCGDLRSLLYDDTVGTRLGVDYDFNPTLGGLIKCLLRP